MLNKIKALFGFGSSPPATVEAPYKVEVVAPVPEPVAESVVPMPVGIEAVIAAPVVETPPAKREPAKRGPAKPKTEKTPKVAAMKVPAVKKLRAPKAK